MAASVKDTDKGWKKLKLRLKSMKGDEVVVGIPGEFNFKKPTQAAIGLVHEMGSADGTTPSRSFLRSTFDRNANKYEKGLARMIEKSVKNGTPAKASLFRLGERVRDDVVDRIQNEDIPQGLAESTKKAFVPGTRTRRGDGHALVNTGTMVGSIVSVVRKRT